MREESTRRTGTRLTAGLALILVYALPPLLPPAAQPLVMPAPDATVLAVVFPNVAHWWMVGRLVALLVGATLIAGLTPAPVVRLPPNVSEARQWKRPWVKPAALLAALAQVAGLPWLSELPAVGQNLFMVWFALPGGLLAWGRASRVVGAPARSPDARSIVRPVAVIIAFWFVCRLVVSWHSPRAADGVDMWRTFGRLVQVAATHANFLTAPMDPQLPGVTCMELVFHGLPVLRMAQAVPTLTFAQVNNACLLAASAALVSWLCASIVSPAVAPVATAAFLFSPIVLVFQLYPLSAAGWLLMTALLGVLLLRLFRGGSDATLAFLGAVAGMTASFPSLAPTTALVLVLVVWRVWRGPHIPFTTIATASCSFVAGLVSGFGLEGIATLQEMLNRYYFLHWSWAVGELAMQGQMTPTIADWVGPGPPAWYVIPLGAALSPFAVARNSLRLWGDVMFEPLSAGLSAVGIAACMRYGLRDRMSLVVLAFLAATMAGGITSTYDRPSQLRLLAATIALALLAAAGLRSIQANIASLRAQCRAATVAVLVIAVSGLLVFDVVNPRILAASAIGLLVRSVDETELEHVALLTAEGAPVNPPGVDPHRRHWELDWLRSEHPYVDDIVRCVPQRPVAIVPVQDPERLAAYEIFFWSPALEETSGIRDRICRTWPGAALYTIVDAAGLSRVYAARPAGPGWRPSISEEQWSVARCAPSAEPPPLIRGRAGTDGGDDQSTWAPGRPGG